MHYSEYVLQNLHYYSDTYICVLNEFFEKVYKNVNSIVDVAQYQEQQYLEVLSLKQNITAENMIKYIIRE